jgi:hypothetical protein
MKSSAEMKKEEWKKKNMMMILEDLIRPWNKIIGKVAEVSEKVSEKNRLEKCKGGNVTSEWSLVLQEVTAIEKKLLEKSEEEAKSKMAEEDQSSDCKNSFEDVVYIEKKLLEKSDWDNIFEKNGDILYLLEGAGKITRARAIQLETAARNKNKEAVFGEMEIVESEMMEKKATEDSNRYSNRGIE